MTSFASALLLSALVPAGHAQAGGCPGASGAAQTFARHGYDFRLPK